VYRSAGPTGPPPSLLQAEAAEGLSLLLPGQAGAGARLLREPVRRLRDQPWWVKLLVVVGALYLIGTAISLLVFLAIVLWAE
jgi:hypothetical protein